MAEDPYQLLGVARDATPEAIRAAYRKLARRHHPDVNPGKPASEERFKAISAAHALLSDPARRARFDRGEIDAEGQERPPAGGWRQYADSDAGERYGQPAEPADFADLFAELFGGGGRAAGPRAGRDEQYRLTVPFGVAVRGGVEQLSLPDGRVLRVAIPPGVETGQVLRLRGQGGAGARGGTPGHALIEVTVADHPLLRREGRDLLMTLPVSLREAVLGAPVEVPTPFGTVRVTVPAGSEAGQQLRLRGKGIPAAGGRAAGDLLLTLRVVIGGADPALAAFLKGWVPARPADPRAGMEALTC